MRTIRLAVLLAAACACDGGAKPRQRPDAGSAQVRTVKPPRDQQGVHVYPPHAIRSDGVGPYLLDMALNDVLHISPEGPRLTKLELGDLLSWQVQPAEESKILIGADEHTRKVAFIAVLAADVARTDGGMTVGMTGAALIAGLGPPHESRDVVRGRKVYEFEKLPNVQFLTNDPPDRADKDTHVVAVLVSRPAPGAAVAPATPAKLVPAGKPGSAVRPPGKLAPGSAAQTAREAARRTPCRSGGELATLSPEELWAAAHPGRGGKPSSPPASTPRVSFGCISGDEPEALLLAGDELAVVGGAPGKLRKVWTLGVGATDQVAPLDVDGDGRDEVIALTVERADDGLDVLLRAWQWEGPRLVPLASQRLFEVSREDAATAGVKPGGIDLWLEVRPGPGALVASGLYVERSFGAVRVVAPLAPVRVRLEPRRVTPTGADAGPSEPAAPSRALDAGGAGATRSDAGMTQAPAPADSASDDGKESP